MHLPAGCGNSRNRLMHWTRTEQRLEVIIAVTTMSEPLDRIWMALRIISPTPPLEPTSSSSTDSKYFNRERPAPALGGRGREGERGWGRLHEVIISHNNIIIYYFAIFRGGGIPGCPPCISPYHVPCSSFVPQIRSRSCIQCTHLHVYIILG